MDTKRLLRRGLENRADRHDIIEETQQQALQKLSDKCILAERAKELWADIDDDYFLRETHHDIAWHTEAVIDAGDPDVTVEFQHDYSFHEDGATQIFIRAKHRTNVFATAASTLDHFNLNIQEARIYGAPNGTTISHYYVLDNEDHSIEHNQELLDKVRAGLMVELALQTDDSGSIHRRTPRELKHFRIPTQTLLYNELASGQTILEVISPDRPGLLARIGSIFLDLGVYLNSAKISTLGERVEDVFAITSRTGEPIHDPDLCAELQEQIRHQLDQQTRAQDSKALA
jgi:[protein-PII] uridylyltransferase